MFPVGNKAKVRKMFGFGVAAAFSEYKKACSIKNSIINCHRRGDEYISRIYCLVKD